MTQTLNDIAHTVGGIASAAHPESTVSGDRVELSTEAERLPIASRAFEVSVALAKTADEIAEVTIDLLT